MNDLVALILHLDLAVSFYLCLLSANAILLGCVDIVEDVCAD